MYLKYVELQGFKSFPDRTRISFDRVLTGIVGPNGSGKSNISDAVRWVLGEQSTKSLRGGKMEDVIFGGTLTTRKPMGFAQVTLCLDNSDGRIPDAGAELLVTRRYYRNGDSEYLINGAQVRLRDVREMFMDTGLGRDGYSIIGQGKIAEVVDSRPMDRREIFEEASGIAKFRFRKNEAERKLEQTEDNLDRLRDITGELELRLGPLKEQSEKAKRFIELSAVRKGLEITLYCDTVKRTRDNLKVQQEKLDIARLDYAAAEEQIASLDREAEALRGRNAEEEALSAGYAEAVEAKNAEIAAAESEAAVLNNDIMHAERDIREMEDDLLSLSKDARDLVADLENRQLQAQEKRASAQAMRESLEGLEKDLALLIEDSAATDRRRSETAARLSAADGETAELRESMAAAASALEELEERKKNVTEAVAAQRERLDKVNAELAETFWYCEKLQQDAKAGSNEAAGYEMKLSSRTEKLRELEQKLERSDRAVADARHRISVLEDMERSMEGYVPPVKRAISAGRAKELRGIIGTVSSLFEVSPGMELAIETALGAAMQNIVTETERDAKEGIDFLKRNKVGRATFIPLDSVTPSKFGYADRLKDAGVVGLASELVTCDAKYRPVADFLLGRTIIAEDLDYASAVARRSGFRVRIVTLDGQVINSGGTYTGGYSSRQAGSFSRKGEMDRLAGEIARIEKETAADRQKKQELEKETSELSAMLDTVRRELETLREDLIRAEAEHERLQRESEALAENNAAGEAELERVENAQAERRSEAARASGRISVLQQEKDRLEAELEADGTPDGFMEQRAALMETMAQRRVSLAELTKDAERLEASAEELRQRALEGKDRSRETDAAIRRLKDEIALRREELASLDEKKAALREQADGLRAGIQESAARRAANQEKEAQLRASRDSATTLRENRAGEMARLDERKISLEAEYNSAVSKLWEDYELTPQEAAPMCVEFTNVTELRSSVASVRGKIRALGSVYVEAIDEYREVKERHDFMTAQIDDVDRSRKQLLDLIDQLETEMKQLFTASFNEINARFHTTFTQLFGGGKADLYLTDENDILGSGIELDVQPPGKVIKNLSALSGGEKALVAIAIYMAILEVNPSPFCILDEIDSALDESNVARFAQYLRRMLENTQMIAITHRRGTMEAADVLYGVTMQEEGVSLVLRLDIDEAKVLIAGEKEKV